LCLRARYGGWGQAAKGVAMLAREIVAPRAPMHRRRALVTAGLGFLRLAAYFIRTPVASTPRFAPAFVGWDFERHREGAFHALRSLRLPRRREPLVSILVRTVGRP